MFGNLRIFLRLFFLFLPDSRCITFPCLIEKVLLFWLFSPDYLDDVKISKTKLVNSIRNEVRDINNIEKLYLRRITLFFVTSRAIKSSRITFNARKDSSTTSSAARPSPPASSPPRAVRSRGTAGASNAPRRFRTLGRSAWR